VSPIPPDFAEMLAQVLKPGEEAAAARVLTEAFGDLDDDQLAAFLEAFAARVRDHSAPVSANELRGLLESCRPASG
jgi:hypothetical protein